MRTLLGCALVIALAVASSISAEDAKVKVDAKKLIGKWELKESPEGIPAGTKIVFEMTDKGKLSMTVSSGGKSQTLEGTYKVEGDRITLTLDINGMENVQTETVTKQTNDELESLDKDGKKSKLARVKEKK